jgi:ribosomal protein L11 methyltransferase
LLEELSRRQDPSSQILDLGTGSGILAIAARLLGFNRIICCDIDPDSIPVAIENFERNVAVSPIFCGSIDGVISESVDLLLCNLTADVIIFLFPEVIRALRPGATAILSGILVEQRNQIAEVVTRNGWRIEEVRTRGEWIALRIRNPAGSHGN